jgi:pimeloyl-ACP methyl ester carboxylesterase
VIEHRIETCLGRLAAYELGQGPPTLLWPSLYVDHASLLPIASELARIRRCILLDPPGHGRSGVPRRGFTLRDCARSTSIESTGSATRGAATLACAPRSKRPSASAR